MPQLHFPTRRGFTLVEVLAVVVILVILLAILAPSLGRAKENARVVQCSSGLHQWGLATGMYLADHQNLLPWEGAASGNNTTPDAWYNALPPYVNAPTYGSIYSGLSVGAAGGFKNEWIWYCPTRQFEKKNSASGINSFHYTFNCVLNGHTSSNPADRYLPNYDQRYNNVYSIPDPARTALLFESNRNIPCDSPATGSTDIARTRHHGDSLNMLYVDQHVELVPGTEVPEPPHATQSPPYVSIGPGGRQTVWGPFKN